MNITLDNRTVGQLDRATGQISTEDPALRIWRDTIGKRGLPVRSRGTGPGGAIRDTAKILKVSGQTVGVLITALEDDGYEVESSLSAEGLWDESKHPRDPKGEFATTGGITKAVVTKETLNAIAEGFTTRNVEDFPWLTRHELSMAEPAQLSQEHMIAADAASRQLKIALSQLPLMRAHPVSITFADYEPKEAAAMMVTGSFLNRSFAGMVINAQNSAQDWIHPPPPGSLTAYGGEEARKMLARGASTDDATKRFYEIAAMHELGHFADRLTNGEMTQSLIRTVLKITHGNSDRALDWIAQHISGYGSTNPRDASAEAFSIFMTGGSLPVELREWQTDLLKSLR